jgi:hypothetical protein
LPNKWSWQVEIDHDCHGVLISLDFVLTSAKCCENKLDKFITFQKEGYKRKAEKIIRHFSSTNDDLDSEICLIKLDSRVTYMEDVYPICLEEEEFDFDILSGNCSKIKLRISN